MALFETHFQWYCTDENFKVSTGAPEATGELLGAVAAVGSTDAEAAFRPSETVQTAAARAEQGQEGNMSSPCRARISSCSICAVVNFKTAGSGTALDSSHSLQAPQRANWSNAYMSELPSLRFRNGRSTQPRRFATYVVHDSGRLACRLATLADFGSSRRDCPFRQAVE